MTGTSETEFSAAEGVDKVSSYVRKRLGGVDILVNNVGGSSAPAGGFAALTDEDWQQALNQNLQAVVRLDRALLPSMQEQGTGLIKTLVTYGRGEQAPSQATFSQLQDEVRMSANAATDNGWRRITSLREGDGIRGPPSIK